MAAEPAALHAILCEDDPQLRRAVAAILQRHGFRAVTVAASGREALEAARTAPAEVIVLDLAAGGTAGLTTVAALRAVAPGSAVLVVCPFPALRPAALASGALELIDPSDLRPMIPPLAAVRQAAHTGVGCDCCAVIGPPTTTIAFDPRTSSVRADIAAGPNPGHDQGAGSAPAKRTKNPPPS